MKSSAKLCLTVLFLAPAAAAQQMIAVDSSRALYTIDITTGAKTQIGTVSSNASTCAGLAYDPATDTVFLSSTGNDSLFTLDITTGTATLVGSYGSSAFVMHGLEFDTSTGTLYGVSQHDNGLYVISQTTGIATLVGTSGLSSFTNLGYDSVNDVMYATNSGTDSFYVMDRATGATTLLGSLGGPTNPNGLAFNTSDGRMYLVDNSTDTLYTINLTTGVATAIGSTGSGNLLGLVWIDGTPNPTTYCTAGTSTNGCVPAIAASAQPSASFASSCVLTVTGVEGQKSGLLFYGIDNTGFTPVTWGTGTSFLCVKAPTQRMSTQSSGGTVAQCDGTLTQDWNAFHAGHPGALGTPFSSGQKVYAQAWYRDPPASKTTNLSDAIELTLVP